MYNPAYGLPGKKIKVTDHQTKKEKAPRNPLGITVDTSVSEQKKCPPEQIFPPESKVKEAVFDSITDSPRKKKNAPPRPLDLKPISSHTQLQAKCRPTDKSKSSPHEAVTPIIVVTPTQDVQATKKITQDTSGIPPVRRPRIASSLYSPVFRRGVSGRWTSPASPPPTIIEGEVLCETKPTPPSGSRLTFRDRDLARRLSGSTALTTPNSSSGWWNVITSPFLNRQSTFGNSQSSPESSSLNSDETPPRDVAAAAGSSRAAVADENQPIAEEFSPSDIETSPFRHYIPPTTGEAAAFYDPNNDFCTPKLQPSAFDTPPMPASSVTRESDSPDRSAGGREIPIMLSRENPEVHDSARKVPDPHHPIVPPPKSSSAPVIEDFGSQTPTAARAFGVDARGNSAELFSPLSPSPIVEVASIATVQTARSVDAEQSRPKNRKPALKVLTTGKNDSTPRENVAPSASWSDSSEDSAEFPSANASPQVISKGRGIEFDKRLPAHPIGSNPESRDMASMHRDGAESLSKEYDDDDGYDTPPPLPPPVDKVSGKLTPPAYAVTPGASGSYSSYRDPEKLERNVRLDKKSIMVNGGRERATGGKWCLIGIGLLLTTTVAIAVIICMTVTKGVSGVSVQEHWLNLTGFPPLPSGISTVSQMKNTVVTSACVSPPEMWSCQVPREQRVLGGGGQPKFRIAILFKNDSVADTSLTQPVRRGSHADQPSSLLFMTKVVKRALLWRRSHIPSAMLDPYPSLPSYADREFLGNTTDGVQQPYSGEETPFFVWFLPTTVPATLKHSKRSSSSNIASLSSLTAEIPSPALAPDGSSAASPELHPYPVAQRLHLFDRGQDTEHYGFYTYFDKSIFLASSTGGPSDVGGSSFAAMNGDGGSLIRDANARCTWSQTRFLVQIWTRKGFASTSRLSDSSAKRLQVTGGVNGTASAFGFAGSGTFPLPVTITLDRHGGKASEKSLYCYGVDSSGDIVNEQRAVHAEDRAYGGRLINPAPGPFAGVDLSFEQGGWGGTDGGTGGCSCEWTSLDIA